MNATTKSRLVVLDVSSLNNSNINQQNKRRRRSKKRHKNVEFVNKEHSVSLPLEIQPVLDAIIAYGRKTNSLGELFAVKTLEEIAKALEVHEQTTPALAELKLNVRTQADLIRNRMRVSYEEEA